MSRFAVVIVLCVLICGAPASAQQNAEGPLTNTAVVKLVKAGFKEKTVIAIINNRPSAFELDPEQLIQLKREGVSENIILAMLSAQDANFINGDELSDDAFFKRTNKPASSGADNSNAGDNIFGSSGGSQSQGETRAGGGGNQNEGRSTGSATVRIMKPPVQAGSSAGPQLEKTPTLNNEGVIRLVEAGFSEGTIIKRIQDSPADFDLSPAGLDELFKRRVTDSIIAAMRAAMGGDSRPK
jgi:hypothetical protein